MTATLTPVRISEVLHVARSVNASDLHLAANHPPVMRVDGMLELQPGFIPTEQDIRSIVTSLLSDAARDKLQNTGDVSVTYRDNELGTVRVHLYRSSSGVSIAMRLLATSVPTIEALHLPDAVATFAQRSSGLVLFAGPTGSGKSTALASLIGYINRTHSKHIITIEDPVEYTHVPERSIMSQRQVGVDVPSFADAVYGALRSDPDVILIGELRDAATMLAAVTAAETGHLVFATVHTGDASQTIERIIGVFSGQAQDQIRMQLAQTLIGIVCMRLLPRANGRGRRSAAEVLVTNDAVRNLVRDGKTHQIRNVIATSRQSGMQTLEAHLTELIERGEITLDVAKQVTERASELRSANGLTA
jgi:twitching motility protein PilT